MKSPQDCQRYLHTLLFMAIIGSVSIGGACAVEISDFPLELAYKAARPVVMMVLDDSGSMDSEFITPENDGMFNTRIYVFPVNPGDNAYGTGYMAGNELRAWKSQWHGYNTLYYNPKTVYSPWPDAAGSGSLPAADTSRPRSNPMISSPTTPLSSNYITVHSAGDSVNIRYSHYYILDDTDDDGKRDSGENIYLVNLNGPSRTVYRFDDGNGNDILDDNELLPVSIDAIPDKIKPDPNPSADLQNFANWYSYYRKRSLMAKAAVSRTISELSGIHMGLFSINRHVIQNAVPVKITGVDGSVSDQSSVLLDKIYKMKNQGKTPLREGLDTIGRYYMGDQPNGLGPTPFASDDDGGECQRVYAIVMTDGYWTETGFSLSPDGNPDGDGYSSTLADVAFNYFYKDLRPDTQNLLKPSGCDPRTFQHMTTFTLSFGLTGTIDPSDFINEDEPCVLVNSKGFHPSWPDPYCEDCKEKIDDLWHAAVNTNGFFFNVSNPETLISSLKEIFENIEDNEASTASGTVSTELFYSTSIFFQGMFNSQYWTGNLGAYRITYDKNDETTEIGSAPFWTAAEKLDGTPPASRRIISFDGSKGIPFNWENLSDEQKAMLNQDSGLLGYLRGESLPRFRKRKSLLGDIVHSSPLLAGEHVYVGANDGMLHAFNASNGTETFAYVPRLVFPNLMKLTDKQYVHRYYVDRTPVCATVTAGGEPRTLLVGGLGKGGKGYYCLDITDVDSTGGLSESGLSDIVKWEFMDVQDLGYTFSDPVIVRTASKNHEYVVVFGNGYNSAGGLSRLFILDAVTGDVIRNFNTGKGNDNGMSSPIVTDVNNDGRGDFVYAGDLKGHVWKWDIRSENEEAWNFSYLDEGNHPAPLFKTAKGQPVTSRPDVMRHPYRHGYMVCFGTGRFLGNSDLQTENIQSVYGIWDYGDDPGEYLGEFDSATRGLSNHPGSQVRLVEQTISSMDANDSLHERTITHTSVFYNTVPDAEDTHPNQRVKQGLPNPVKDAGWFLNLPESERVYQNVRIWNNVLIVLARTPSLAPCEGGGYTVTYYLKPSSGGMVEKATCIEKPVALTPPVIVTTPAGDRMVFGTDFKMNPLPDGGMKNGMYFWRQFF